MKIASTRYSDTAFNFATFILRIGAGSLMIINHGLMKMNHFSQMSNGFIDPFHIGSSATLSLVIFAEVFCSALIILGLFTRLACIPLIFEMVYAFIKVHHLNYDAGQGVFNLLSHIASYRTGQNECGQANWKIDIDIS
jgi:putative oxidoreductase